MAFETLLASVERYYTGKLRDHGATARGVDWNSAESQALRFERLLEVCPAGAFFSINDVGCGYGALADYLMDRGSAFEYRGYDISAAMVEEARRRHAGSALCRFTNVESELRRADYSVASGIFNVKLDATDAEWRRYVEATIARLADLSARGFAFNMLTRHGDPERREARLFYADPAEMFDWCRTRISRRVALLHDYPLFEFTILVRT